jgi:hypothetical protein
MKNYDKTEADLATLIAGVARRAIAGETIMGMQEAGQFMERHFPDGPGEWKVIADKLALALDGCRKRYVLTLGEITGDPVLEFMTPAPSALDNIKAVALALAEYDILSNVPDEVSPLASGGADAPASDVPEVPKARGLTPSAR